MYDYLIVGAGFSGAVLAERIANKLAKKILIIDRRSHIGGNAYDFYDESGILIHKYGPHWFHTNNKEVFDYLSLFTSWYYHYHRVKTMVDGQMLPIPINMDTLSMLYNLKFNSPDDVRKYLENIREKIEFPKNAQEQVLSVVGKDLYDKFFKNYTMKQWNISPDLLSPSVTARIPTRLNKDDRYFEDKYQVMPKNGYTSLFNNLLNSKDIHIMLQTDYKDIINDIKFDKLIYTGAIDEFFDYSFGSLPYRSLRFSHETLDQEYYQPCQQVNYPNDYDFTRIVEWKHATKQKLNKTTITFEYPEDYNGKNERYYPVPLEESSMLFNKYRKEADKLSSVIFSGRLADYKYYNMDQVIAKSLTLFKNTIAKQ